MELPKLAAPAQRALAAAGISTLEDLTKFTVEEVKGLHGMGPGAMKKIESAMAEHGLAFVKK